MRRPLQKAQIPRSQSSRYQGIEPENVPREIFLLCTTREGIDHAMYQALHTTLDLGDMFDLLEIMEVQQTWTAAALANAKLASSDG